MTTPGPPPHHGVSATPQTELWRTRADLSPPSGALQRRRVPGWVVALAVATAVMSVVSFTTVLLWSGGGGDGPSTAPPLSFHAFEVHHRIDFDESSRMAFTRLDGDLAYVGWAQDTDLELRAVNLQTRQEAWRQRIIGSPDWGEIFPVPGGVIVVGVREGGAERMYAHDAGDGRELWRHDVSPDDWASVTAGNLVWFHAPSERLRGVDLTTGAEDWSIPMSVDAVTTWVVTERDLQGPTDTGGFIGLVSTDSRLVVVDGDTTSIIDGRNGGVLSQTDHLAGPRDQLLGYGGRLYVAASGQAFQLVSYDLDNLSALPRTHYRAAPEQSAELIEACGDGRVCVLETETFSRDTTELVVVDVSDDSAGEPWRVGVPDARTVLPVGPWLLAVGQDGPVVGFDGTGLEVLQRPGVAARLDSGNLLVFGDYLASFERDVTVAGVAVQGERPIELGQLPGVFGERCSWDVTLIACPDRDGATIWRFADA